VALQKKGSKATPTTSFIYCDYISPHANIIISNTECQTYCDSDAFRRINTTISNKKSTNQGTGKTQAKIVTKKWKNNYGSMWNKSSFGFFPLYTKLVDLAHIVVLS
jgi:hypothetical protein